MNAAGFIKRILTFVLVLFSIALLGADNVGLVVNCNQPTKIKSQAGLDHNMQGMVSSFEKSEYIRVKSRVVRTWMPITLFFPGGSSGPMYSYAQLDAYFFNRHSGLQSISDAAAKLMFDVCWVPSWMGSGSSFNTAVVEQSLKSMLTYLKLRFPKFEYVEAWNEPDLGNNTDKTSGTYNTLYACFSNAVKYVNANIDNGAKLKLGGPVHSGYSPSWTSSLFSFVKTYNHQLDFVDWHCYTNTGATLYSNISDCKTKLAASGLSAEIVISEYGDFPGGGFCEEMPSKQELAQQAATVADQNLGFVRAGGDVMMTWTMEHPFNERKSLFATPGVKSQQATGWQTINFKDTTAKYFMLQFYYSYVKSNGSRVQVKVNDIQLLDAAGLPVTLVNDGSSTDNTSATKVIDNNATTYWITNAKDSGVGMIYFKVASSQTVSQLKINWGDAFSHRFDLWGATDTTKWTRLTNKEYHNPAWYLIELSDRMGDSLCTYTTTNSKVNVMATVGDTSLALVVNSRDNSLTFANTLTLRKLPAAYANKSLRVRRYLVDETHSNFAYSSTNYGLALVQDTLVNSKDSLRLVFTMIKQSVSFIEIVPSATTVTTYTLTVNSGSGSGKYIAGKIVNITASAPATGKLFDKWTGATAGIANINASSTTITMPASNVSITATYKDAPMSYQLTVNYGSGSASYAAGKVVAISANVPVVGKAFDKWTGDVAGIANVNATSTTLTMPAANATITATYKNIMYNLVVNGGSGDGSYALGTKVTVTADPAPAGKVFDKWIGAVNELQNAYDATTVYTIAAKDAAVTATYKDATTDLIDDLLQISLYPNPASSVVTISKYKNFRMEIIASDGSIITNQQVLNEDSFSVSVESLKPGSYFVRLTDDLGNIRYLKFIKN